MNSLHKKLGWWSYHYILLEFDIVPSIWLSVIMAVFLSSCKRPRGLYRQCYFKSTYHKAGKTKGKNEKAIFSFFSQGIVGKNGMWIVVLVPSIQQSTFYLKNENDILKRIPPELHDVSVQYTIVVSSWKSYNTRYDTMFRYGRSELSMRYPTLLCTYIPTCGTRCYTAKKVVRSFTRSQQHREFLCRTRQVINPFTARATTTTRDREAWRHTVVTSLNQVTSTWNAQTITH